MRVRFPSTPPSIYFCEQKDRLCHFWSYMKELKNIKTFLFDKAQYRVSDSRGNKGVLKVNYKNGSYQIKGNALEKSALKEISAFADDLVARKSGKNFVETK